MNFKKAVFKRKIKQARTAFEFDQKDNNINFDFEQAEELMGREVLLFDQDEKPKPKKFKNF